MMEPPAVIIEQVRYYISDEDSEKVRRERVQLDAIRVQLGLRIGIIMVADVPPDEGPAVVWQCGYETETELAVAETAIAGSQEYATARDRLVGLVSRAEIELYTVESAPTVLDDVEHD